MTNEERLDFLVRTGKLSLMQMAARDEFCNPVIVHEEFGTGEIQIAMLAGGLGENNELLIEGLVQASLTPKAMISLTSDAYMAEAAPGYGIGNQGQVDKLPRPGEMFRRGVPGVSEALHIIAAFAGEDDVVEVFIPYTREGKHLVWGDGKWQISESKLAGAIRAAVSCSHATIEEL
jgi:hypothetical protein